MVTKNIWRGPVNTLEEWCQVMQKHVRPSALWHPGLTPCFAWFHPWGVNTRSLRADCIPLQWEEISWRSGCWIVRSPARGEKKLISVQAQGKMHGTVRSHWKHSQTSKAQWAVDIYEEDALWFILDHLTETLKRRVWLFLCDHNTAWQWLSLTFCRVFIDITHTTVISLDIPVL